MFYTLRYKKLTIKSNNMEEYEYLHQLAELNYVDAKEENHPEIDDN